MPRLHCRQQPLFAIAATLLFSTLAALTASQKLILIWTLISMLRVMRSLTACCGFCSRCAASLVSLGSQLQTASATATRPATARLPGFCCGCECDWANNYDYGYGYESHCASSCGYNYEAGALLTAMLSVMAYAAVLAGRVPDCAHDAANENASVNMSQSAIVTVLHATGSETGTANDLASCLLRQGMQHAAHCRPIAPAPRPVKIGGSQAREQNEQRLVRSWRCAETEYERIRSRLGADTEP